MICNIITAVFSTCFLVACATRDFGKLEVVKQLAQTVIDCPASRFR